MEKERKIRILSIGALLVAIIGLTVAFAAMSRTLIINGTATVDSAKWDIHFENPLLKSKKGDAREVSAPVISEDGGDLTLKVGLRKPQDEIVYNVDVVNDGDIDAEITKIDYPELSEEHDKIIEFEAVYDDGSSIALKQELKVSESKKVKITIRFKDIEDESLLAREAYNIPLTFKIHYTQSGVTNGGEGTPDGGGDVVGGEPDYTLDSNGTILTYNPDKVVYDDEGYLVVPALNSEGKEIKNVNFASFAQKNFIFVEYDDEFGEQVEGYLITDEENFDAIKSILLQEEISEENIFRLGEKNDFPEEIDYHPGYIDILTGQIDEDAIYDEKNNIKINLLNSTHITTIKRDTFIYATITNIIFPSSLQSIESFAFERSNLTGELIIPSSVTYIGTQAFFGSSKLTKITIKRANSDGITLEANWNGNVPYEFNPNYPN